MTRVQSNMLRFIAVICIIDESIDHLLYSFVVTVEKGETPNRKIQLNRLITIRNTIN